MPKITLNPHLEKALVSSILAGTLPPEIVKPEELSKIGRVILSAIKSLFTQGVATPIHQNTIALTASEVSGGSPTEIGQYLRGVMDASLRNPKEILTLIRNKQVLVDIINEAGRQLTEVDFDMGAFGQIVGVNGASEITNLTTELGDDIPDLPTGIPIKSLPLLTEKTGGIYGMWAIAGPPGVGKSALAEQIALDVGQTMPVIMYDFENGKAILLYRAYRVFGKKLKKLGENIYIRESIRTLEADLACIKAPALVIVDSVQKLPASMEFRRTGLDRWIHRLENLKKKGYHILLVSEVGRALYDAAPTVGAFKETGEIEYSADLGIQLLDTEGGEVVEAHIVKNRHHPHRGYATSLSRVRDWWFRESIDSPEPGES